LPSTVTVLLQASIFITVISSAIHSATGGNVNTMFPLVASAHTFLVPTAIFPVVQGVVYMESLLFIGAICVQDVASFTTIKLSPISSVLSTAPSKRKLSYHAQGEAL
tara:strand:- start:5493 stop:5813 length:321 start_codon:yes stop_codon:yes gene_type:complete